jgi:nucleotide-binding universal stress UspA family protein
MATEQIFRKILVPVDDSTPSLVAQELAAFIAKKLKSEVTLINVVSHEFMRTPEESIRTEERHEHPPMGTMGGQMPATFHASESPSSSLPNEVLDEVADWYHQKGEEAIENAVALFKEEGVSADHKIVEHASPADTILNVAHQGKYDLIAMGASGEDEQGPHLGSIAGKVLHNSQVPVLIGRNKSRISKILVPVDGSEIAQKALEHAAVLAKLTDATMTLLYVLESGLFKLKPDVSKEIGNRILSKAAERVKGTKLQRKMDSGNPAKKIIQTAEEEDYDLIVMGGRGLGAIERFILGSVSDHVVHYANRSVLIVK